MCTIGTGKKKADFYTIVTVILPQKKTKQFHATTHQQACHSVIDEFLLAILDSAIDNIDTRVWSINGSWLLWVYGRFYPYSKRQRFSLHISHADCVGLSKFSGTNERQDNNGSGLLSLRVYLTSGLHSHFHS